MARIACAEGITVVACTPHILPSVYENTGEAIKAATRRLGDSLVDAGIELRLVSGADVHATPDLVAGLNEGRIPTLAGSRYFLLEPPHHLLTPRFVEYAVSIVEADYVPILTHPERAGWIDAHYGVIGSLFDAGVVMQLTAASVIGKFGRKPRYWAERMLDEGKVHLLATDAHDARRRPPLLAEARTTVAARHGEAAAHRLVVENPLSILENVLRLAILPMDALVLPEDVERHGERKRRRWAWGTRKH